MYVVVTNYIWIGRSWPFSIYVRYCGTACVYFSFRWGPFVHSLGIVQWNSTRRDHPGNHGRVSRSAPVTVHILDDHNLRSGDRYWATDVKVLGSSDGQVFGDQCWS